MKQLQIKSFDGMKGLTEKEALLLRCLRQNGRDSLTSMSKKTRVPISSLFDRLKLYQKSVIDRYTCILNFSRLGLFAHSFSVFSIPKPKREEMRQFFVRHPKVNSVFRINHRYDFLVETVFTDLKEREDFLDVVEERFSVRPRHVFSVVESLCREAVLARDVACDSSKKRDGQSRFFGSGR